MSRDEIFSKQTNVKAITKEKVRIERMREDREKEFSRKSWVEVCRRK